MKVVISEEMLREGFFETRATVLRGRFHREGLRRLINNAVLTTQFQQPSSNNVVQSFQQFNFVPPNPILSTVNKSFIYGTRLF